MKALAEQIAELDEVEIYGRVVSVRGLMVEVAGPIHAMSVGARVIIETGGGRFIPCEVVGFTGANALLMPFAALEGVRRGCKALVTSAPAAARPSPAWLGRVVNAMGEPIDGKGPLPLGPEPYPFRNPPPPAHARRRVGGPLDLGVRALNTFVTCCRGQRMGVFAGSGVGKSVLLSMMARNVAADVSVIGLVGERGREVQEFLQDDLGEAGLKRSVVVVSTSDEPALMRRQAAYLTLSIAEYFRDDGQGRAGADGLGHALRHGAARDRPLGRRAADRQGLYADRVHRIAAPAGAGRPRDRGRHHHRHLHRAGRRRRPQRADRGCGALDPRRPHRDGTCDRGTRALSGDQRPEVGLAHHAEGGRSGLPAGRSRAPGR